MSLKPYPKYKDSGIEWLGKLPRHWKTIRNKFLVKFYKGKNPAITLEEETKEALPYLSMDYLRGNSNCIYAYEFAGGYKVTEGQVLVIWDGSNAGEFILGKKGYLSSTMAAIELETKDFVDIFYWYSCVAFETEVRKYANGMGIPHVDSNQIKNILVPSPPKQEQQTIANFLDHETSQIDSLIAEQENLIELLKEKRQAVISHAVTKGLDPDIPMKDSGIKWLGKVPEHWKVKRLKHLAELNPSKSGYKGSKEIKCSFIPMEKLKTAQLILDENKIIKEVFDGYTYFQNNDVVFAKVTPCFENKNTAIAENLTNGIGFGSSEIYVFRPILITSKFLFYRLLEEDLVDYWTSEMTGAGGLKRVPSDIVQNFKISLPGNLEQKKITDYLDQETSKIDSLINEATKGIELLKERRTALISAAVTGKIDVRDWQVPKENQSLVI